MTPANKPNEPPCAICGRPQMGIDPGHKSPLSGAWYCSWCAPTHDNPIGSGQMCMGCWPEVQK